MWMLSERSIVSFCKHYDNVTFESSLKILKKVATFKNVRGSSNISVTKKKLKMSFAFF